MRNHYDKIAIKKLNITLESMNEYMTAISCTGEIDISANIETTRHTIT